MFERIRIPSRQATHSMVIGILALTALASAGTAVFAQITEIVSISSAGQQGDDISGRYTGPAINGDGRIVAFDSQASTLVPGDTNQMTDVFVRDRTAGTTDRVSVSSTGLQADGTSTRPGLDASGDRVIFDSAASNLIAGDTNGALDVFMHTRSTHSTQRVSVSSSGTQGNGASYSPTISADGRYVCFVSAASNLVAGDTNNVEDIFVRDLVANTTERASLGDVGQQANSSSTLASISADGRWVAFISYANNLVTGDTNDQFDVFIHDRVTGLTERVSVDSNGQQADGLSSGPSVSGDGQFVAFWSDATNLVPGDTNARRDIFVRDRIAGITERVSVSTAGEQGDGNSQDPAVRGFTATGPQISPDGRFVVFFSSAANLVPDDTNTCPPVFQSPPGRCPDAFVRDRLDGTTTRVNVASDGTQANDRTADPVISSSGMFVAFFSAAGNLVSNDTNSCPPIFPDNCPDIFVHEVTLPADAPVTDEHGAPSASLSVAARPDPTGDAVQLSFAGAYANESSLIIYDAAGRTVRGLARGKLAAGTVTWDGRDDHGERVAAGTYFCRLTSGSSVATEKVTLLRK